MNAIDPNLAVFQSWPDFADNPRALYEHIVAHTDLEAFWVVRDAEVCRHMRERGVACALEGSTEAQEKISQAQFLISAAYELAYEKRRGQIFISAWHGFALKLTGFFDSAVMSPDAFTRIRAMSTQFDIVASTSMAGRLFFAGMYACDPRKVFATGYPRNDYLFSEDGRGYLRQLLGDAAESKLILYLPTMRKSLKEEGAQFEENVFNYADYDPDTIDQLLAENDAYMIAKLHPSDDALFDQDAFQLPSRMILLRSESLTDRLLTLYHILNGFDCLITDYSSIYVDYLLLDRPIIFSCPDIAQYGEDRGFCVDDPRLLMPGALVESQRGLLRHLTLILEGSDEYAPRRSEMMSFFHTYRDGGSAERLFRIMESARQQVPADIAKDGANLYIDPASPLYQYALEVTGEVFYDFGTGFSADISFPIVYLMDESRIRIALDVPEGAVRARFDPCETGRLAMKDLVVTIDGRQACYEDLRGVQIGDTIIFSESDPQIIVGLEDLGAKEVVLEFTPLDIIAGDQQQKGKSVELLIDAYKRARGREEELERVYSSRSWKLIERIRSILRRR